GWEKGVVEKSVQDTRRRIWAEVREQRFASFGALNEWLAKRCLALWLEMMHPLYPALTIAEALDIEREHLMPMPEPFDGYVQRTVRVSSTCLVSVARNRYSVPCEWAGKLVSTRLYPTRVSVAAGDVIVACHDRRANIGQIASQARGLAKRGTLLGYAARIAAVAPSPDATLGRGAHDGRCAGMCATSWPGGGVGGRCAGTGGCDAERADQRGACG
ncbi:MAG: hypothetical protein EBS61_09960, partial [Betaproteobacteria bacterium]|nr:hypothetical protein [Betaproteobacteria bacterium]